MSKQALMTPLKGGSDAKFVLVSQRKLIVEEPDEAVSTDPVESKNSAPDSLVCAANAKTQMASGGSVLIPPPIKLFATRQLTIRFASSGTVSNVTPTPNQVLSLFGAISTSNTTAAAIHNRFRVVRVTMWPPAAGQAALAWDTGSQFSVPDQVKIDEIPTGISISRRLTYTPPVKSLAASWQKASSSSSDSPFTYSLSAGGMVEVTCELSQAVVVGAVALSSAGMSGGQLYYGYLGSASVTPIGPSYGTLFT